MKTAGRVRRPGPLGVFAVAFTLLLEIGFPFLVWTRLRPVMS